MATDGTRPDVDPASTATAGGADVMAAGWRACWSSSGFDGRRFRPSSRVHCTGASIRPDDCSGARRSSVGPGADGSAGTERADPQYTPRQALIIESAAMGATNAASHPLGNTSQSATSSTPATDTSFVERHVTTDNRMFFLQQFQQPAVAQDYNAMQFQHNVPQRPADSSDRAAPPTVAPPPVTTGGGLRMQTPNEVVHLYQGEPDQRVGFVLDV